MKKLTDIVKGCKKYWQIGKDRGELARKKKGHDGYFSRHINRKISAPIAALLYEANSNINPNSITVVSSAIGVVGAGVLILSGGDPAYAIIGASLVQTSSIADGIDGDYSRYLPKEKRSDQEREFGGHLDTMFDRVVDSTAIYGAGEYLDAVFPGNNWAKPLSYTMMFLSQLSPFSGHHVKEVYNKFKKKGIKKSKAIKYMPAARDYRIFALFCGGVGEGISYFVPEMQGIPMTAALTVSTITHSVKIIDRSLILKKDLYNIPKKK